MCYRISKAYGCDMGTTRDVGVAFYEDCAKTVTNGTCPGHHNHVVVSYALNHAITIGGGALPLEGNGSRPTHHGDGYGKEDDPMFTLNTTEVHAVAYRKDKPPNRGGVGLWMKSVATHTVGKNKQTL